MKVSYSWLKEYVDTNIDPKKLAHLLTMTGVTVAACESAKNDYIFEFEITANRRDCLSVLGIAREVASLLGKKLKIPAELSSHTKKSKTSKSSFPIAIKLEDSDLCYRYTARFIKNVEVKSSPDWLKDKLLSIGLRPVNNIVDITNFVLYETGQPLHAFDMDRLKGSVYIRRAKKNEKIITIDNTPRVCDGDMLLITDDTGPIALAGVMGGLNTEVTEMTKNILLESAFFDPISVRRTSRKFGISSDSSYRFERKIDNAMVKKASDRASSLIEKLASGKLGPILDTGKKSVYSKTIELDAEKTSALLGIEVTNKKAKKILKTLGFAVTEKKKTLKVTTPTFREDVKSDVDLTEEIARIHGYEKIPLTIPKIVGNLTVKDFPFVVREKICDILTRLELDEIITYSLIGRESVKQFWSSEDAMVSIKNPLSIDQEIMRPTLLVGMLEAVKRNLNRKVKRIALFECGKIYMENKASYIEEEVVSIGLAGINREDWKVKTEEFDFYDLKGLVETLLRNLGITKNIVFSKKEQNGFDKTLSVVANCNGRMVAHLGEVNKETCQSYDIEKKVFYGEIFITQANDMINLERRYTALGKYPSITRDISLLMEEGVPSSELLSIIRDKGEGLVKDVSLLDYYKGKQVPKGKRALLYRIEYRSNERTLKDSEVDKLEADIKKALVEKLNVSFR